MKTQEVPIPLRGFFEQFRKLEHRHNYAHIYDDFLTAILNFFTPPIYKPHDIDCFKRYTEAERQIFSHLIAETIKIFSAQVLTDTDWFDPFGDFYQLLSSRSKASALGQFFTPSTIIDLMTQIQGTPEELTGKGLMVNDPACGSGRCLIAFHAAFPGNYMYGEDLDLMCCKMACVNLMIHGCEGQIVCRDSLAINDFRYGWQINGNLRRTGLPSIVPIDKEASVNYKMGLNSIDQHTRRVELEKLNETEKLLSTVGIQMGMFS